MSGQRRPFLNVHRLAVLAPVWILGLVGLGVLAAGAIKPWLPGGLVPVGPFVIGLGVLLIGVTFYASRCPRCGAMAFTHDGGLFGWRCTFFAHEECPQCGLDLCAVTPWGAGIKRQRQDWIAALPQPRKFWIEMGASRIILTRIVVLTALIYGLPLLWDGVAAARAALGG